MRRKIKNRKKVGPDTTYNSENVSKLINYIMKSGKKEVARRVVYGSFDVIKEKGKTENPIEVFTTAIKNVAPQMEVRSRRVGGANYQVPVEVRAERKLSLAFRWIIAAALSKKGSPMKDRLAEELLAASRNEGEAVKKRENVHKMAEANKAFAHFSW